MQRRSVGSSGLQVSRAGLGTMTWGRDAQPSGVRALARAFVEAGGNLVDTAAAYGGGEAERMIGRLIRTDLARDDLVIATKAGFRVRDGERVVDTSKAALLADLEGSLRRLHTDHVDIWQVHAYGDAPIEETLAALDLAVAKGMALYVGVSNFVGWQTAQAATWQRAWPGRAPIVSAQVEYSLLARRAEVEVLPAVRALGLGFFAWSPLGRGALTGKYRTGIPADSRGAADHFAWFVEPYLEQRSRAVVDAVARAAAGLGLETSQVAWLWLRDSPAVTAGLLGARTPSQLASYLDVEDEVLPPEIVSALDDVSGGPNQGRPEAPAPVA